jgi:hypothetical protein
LYKCFLVIIVYLHVLGVADWRLDIFLFQSSQWSALRWELRRPRGRELWGHTLRVRAITENFSSFRICSTRVLPTEPVAPATATVGVMTEILKTETWKFEVHGWGRPSSSVCAQTASY